jgi:hypothetical protein
MIKRPWDFEKDELTCSYCGKKKKGISFILAPCDPNEWALHMIYTKVSCPDCYNKARIEYGQGRDIQYELTEVKEDVKKQHAEIQRLRAAE